MTLLALVAASTSRKGLHFHFSDETSIEILKTTLPTNGKNKHAYHDDAAVVSANGHINHYCAAYHLTDVADPFSTRQLLPCLCDFCGGLTCIYICVCVFFYIASIIIL